MSEQPALYLCQTLTSACATSPEIAPLVQICQLHLVLQIHFINGCDGTIACIKGRNAALSRLLLLQWHTSTGTWQRAGQGPSPK